MRERTPESEVLHGLLQLKNSASLATGDIVSALSEVTEFSVSLLNVVTVRVYQLSADGETLDCVHAFSSRGEVLQSDRLEQQRDARYFESLRAVGFFETSASETSSAAALRPHRPQCVRMDGAVRLRGRMVGVVSFEREERMGAFQFWERLSAFAVADFLAMVLQVRAQLRGEAQLQKQQAYVEELLESRTNAAVRENADLQREVDALQLAAETIRKSEDERRKLFAASPVPMLLVSKQDQVIRFANDCCAQTLRCSVSELSERAISELFMRPSDHQDVLAALEAHGEIDARELQLRGHDGEGFWALLSARTMQFGEEDAVLVAFSDLTAQKTVEHQLRTLAQRDPLTQAYNRHYFWQLAASEISRARRYQRPLSLAMVDADYFKNINDQYGHDVGDMVLCSLVSICQETLRVSDVLARYGGEEFVVLLPETPREGAEVVMERLRERVANTPVVLDDGREVTLTVSVGLAAFQPSDANVEQLIKRADEAVYAAKRGGRNRVAQR